MSDAAITSIRVPLLLWARVIPQLRKRGENRRESGAFLLGRWRGPVGKVSRFVCYDDLDPDAYQGGGIQFHKNGYAALWTLCRETSLEVLCDVHTHPGANVRQSPIDKNHPMIAVVGHTAMIVPSFARTSRWSLDHVGVYEYLGSYRWQTHEPRQALRRVKLMLW